METYLLLIFSFVALSITDPVKSNAQNTKVKVSILSKKNITGHYETYFSAKQISEDLPQVLKIDFEHGVMESDGLKVSDIRTNIKVPPPLPVDYKLFPGIGYYKFHVKPASNFDDAVSICFKEGGYLAIINSKEESDVLKSLLNENPESKLYPYPFSYLGFHDRHKEGEFLTIFGQPLSDTGFMKWASHQEPNGGDKENCGTLNHNGGLNDYSCNVELPFICEYEISWIIN